MPGRTEIFKFLFTAVCAVAALTFVTLLWRESSILAIILGVISLLMLANEGERGALYTYTIGAIFGPFAEFFPIQMGAWKYATPDVFGFPLWLPLVWGTAALFLRRANIFLHRSLIEKKNSPSYQV